MVSRLLPALAASALLLGTSACIGQGDDKEALCGEGRTPEEAMELAKETLDDAAGLELDLYASDLPRESDGLVRASGAVVRPASFTGSGVARAGGFEVEAELRAIDDMIWIRSEALGNRWLELAALKQFGFAIPEIPNPAELLSPDAGLSTLLLETEDLGTCEVFRGGEDNKELLSSYDGTLPGAAVREVVPMATGDEFAMEYLLTSDAELREMRITGEFYSGGTDVTYVVNLSDYGHTEEIKAP